MTSSLSVLRWWSLRRARLAAWGTQTVLAMTALSMVSTFLQYEEARRSVTGATVLFLTAGFARSRPLVCSLLLSAGATLAIGVSSRETFSVWPAASGLLVLASLPRIGTRRTKAVQAAGLILAAILGTWWAAAQPPTHIGPAGLSVVVAAVAIAAVKLIAPLLTMLAVSRAEAEELRKEAALAAADRVELERRHQLARELHDSIGHHLTAMVVQAEAGQVTAPHQALESIGSLGREALKELEDVVFGLRQPLELEHIRDQLVPPLIAAGIDVDVTRTSPIGSPALEHTVYRIVQESLTNVMRHSHASHVDVAITDTDAEEIHVVVTDNGVGLPDVLRHGAGLDGIRHRAEAASGTAHIRSSSPHGVTVDVRLPRTVQ